jgi:hypothetical protein
MADVSTLNGTITDNIATVDGTAVANVATVNGTTWPSFLPTDIASLEIWVRSDLGITKDGGDAVATWADQSGNGNDFNHVTNKPTWVDSQINGEAVVKFDGTNDEMQTASITLNRPMHFFVVLEHNSWVSEDAVMGGRATPSWRLFQFGSSPDLISNGGAGSTASAGLALNTFGMIHGLVNSTTENWLALNDGAETANTANIGTYNHPGGIRLGAGYTTASQFGACEIAELAVFSAEVTGSDLTDMLAYFSDRYAIW